MIVINDSFIITYHYKTKKWIIQVSQMPDCTHLSNFFTMLISLRYCYLQIYYYLRQFDVFYSTTDFKCSFRIADRCLLAPWSYSFVSPLRNFTHQYGTVRSQVDPSFDALIIMTKLENMQKSKHVFFSSSRWRIYNVLSWILKNIDIKLTKRAI